MLKKLGGLFLFVFVFGLFQVCTADSGSLPDAVAVFDLSSINENGNIIPKIYFSQDPNKFSDFSNKIANPELIKDQKPENVQSLWNEIFDTLKKKFIDMEVADCGRWISRKNQIIDVYVIYRVSIKVDDIKIAEDKRDSRIFEDLKTLLQIIPLAKGKAIEAIKIESRNKRYYLEKTRAKIKISVAISKVPSPNTGEKPTSGKSIKAEEGKKDPSATPSSSKDEKKDSAEALYIELLTGPSEHFFLSADVPIFSLGDAKFVNNKDNSLGIAPKDTPTSVFVGFNIQFEDVLKESIVKLPYLKLMIQFSKTPFDAFGVGLGWNLPKVGFLEKLGFKTNAICLFGGIFWAKESDSNGQESKHRYQWRYGLSYDLSRISDWFKK